MKNKILITAVFIIAIFFGLYFVLTNGKGAYKLGGTRGVSKTIEESKSRGVFMFEMDYSIIPDSIKFTNPPNFFMEKAYRYGEWSSKDTEPLSNEHDSYQVNYSKPERLFNYDLLIKDYYLSETWLFNKVRDTISREIVTKSPPYDSIYSVGELKLFRKRGHY